MKCNCSLNITEIIGKYIKYGWLNLSDIFQNNNAGKEKYIKDKCVNSELLSLLGNIRYYIINNLFNCVNNSPKNKYVAYGSTNITSDYDLTIVGPDAPLIVWRMFQIFLKQNKNTSSFSFDTNLYCVGLYNKQGIKHYKELISIDEDTYILEPKTQSDKELCLVYAFTKLLDLNISKNSKFPKIKSYIHKSQKIKNKLNKLYKTKYNSIKTKKYNKETLDYITKYKIYTNIAKQLFDCLYKNKKNKKSVIELATVSTNFAIEAYYTPCTFNVVVMEIQGGYKMKLSNINYVCSVIENLGDMMHHIQHDSSNNFKQVLLKYSKYVYRILYSLGKASKNKQIIKNASKINKLVIPHRSTGDVSKVDFSLLMLKKNQTLQQYLTEFSLYILNQLERLL